jgi:hypothetical protein
MLSKHLFDNIFDNIQAQTTGDNIDGYPRAQLNQA